MDVCYYNDGSLMGETLLRQFGYVIRSYDSIGSRVYDLVLDAGETMPNLHANFEMIPVCPMMQPEYMMIFAVPKISLIPNSKYLNNMRRGTKTRK